MNYDPQKKAGAYVMRRGRKLIGPGRSRTKPRQAPGAPRSRAPGDPMRRIMFDIEGVTRIRTLVGFIYLGGGYPTVPELHEYGKTRAITFHNKIIRYKDKMGRTVPKGKGRAEVVKQWETRRVVHFKERPTMATALKRARPKLPGFWLGSVNPRTIRRLM